MRSNLFIAFTAALILGVFSNLAAAHMHTHVGRNADGVWGNADDNTLWIFATPSQPNWGVIEMTPTGDVIDGKNVYRAELDCWHSAHPDSGLFQLDFNDHSIQPDWRIGLKRIGFSNPDNFWMQDESTTLPILENNGDTFAFEEPDWDAALPNGSGGLGAWHFHTHTEFLAMADKPGKTFSATFTAIDNGATQYSQSAQFTIDFVTVPEPASLILLAIGAFAGLRKNK